jgi:lipid-A-disaccharide synthase
MIEGKDIILSKGEVQEVLSISDVALITSGTATLQAAIKGVPLVIIYKVSPITYLLGRLLVKVKNIGIVNILAGREIVPELIQSDANPEKIADVIKKILDEPVYRDNMKKNLLEVREKLGSPGASERAAEAIIMLFSRKLN